MKFSIELTTSHDETRRRYGGKFVGFAPDANDKKNREEKEKR